MLTKEDILALRAADDSVCFSWTKDDGAKITARKKVANKLFSDSSHTMEREIEVDSTLSLYRAFPGGEKEATGASEVLLDPKFNTQWQTICHFLRVGDELTLYWQGAMEKADLTADELILRIARGKGKETNHYEFFVSYRVTPPDSSARMVRP